MSKQLHQVSRDQLVDQLIAELPDSKSHYNVYLLLFGWICIAWIFSIGMTLLQAPLRTSWAEQLATSPQFILEMGLGLAVVVLIALITFQKAVPALSRFSILIAAVVVTFLWLATLSVEIYFPPFSPSMEGKRALCDLEVVAYSIPLMVLGFVILKKGFVLNWTAAGFGVGLASGFIPALLMQLACMYNPSHALQCHILPAVLVGGIGAIVGFFMSKTSADSK
ncbi:MAG: DUF1109 domain-containing protein [Cellvibrionaceae bacterium]